MGKKKSWFSAVKRLFIPEGKPKEEKNKGWKGVFRRQKIKQCPAISVPQKTLIEANKEQRKHALAVAVATAAAAEAAVNAAHAAAEFVRLTSTPSYFGKIACNSAATTIQTSFRAYLARKALKALKGVVMLQAVIRGQNVRRVIITHLKSLQSIDIGTTGRRLHKLRNGLEGESEEMLNSSLSLPRRSFCTANKQEYNSIIDHTLPNYPGFPTYMAATESAKAKIRSASTPRHRHGYLDFSAVHSSLYKPRQSSWSSFDGDLAGVKGKSATSRHKSLRI